jgi:hypothetical protein
VIWVKRKQKYFCERGWTGKSPDQLIASEFTSAFTGAAAMAELAAIDPFRTSACAGVLDAVACDPTVDLRAKHHKSAAGRSMGSRRQLETICEGPRPRVEFE